MSKPKNLAMAIALAKRNKPKKMAEGGEIKPSPSPAPMEEDQHDMDMQDLRKKRLLAKGGMVSDSEDHYSSIADAILAKKRRESAPHDEVDLSLNAVEEPNNLDDANFDALRKENYSESAGLDALDQPEDSNEHGHKMDDEHDMSLVDAIRRKRKK